MPRVKHRIRKIKVASTPVVFRLDGGAWRQPAAAPGQHARAKRGRWVGILIAVVIVLIALGLAANAAAASYESLSGEAAKHGVPLARLNPLALDGGLFAVITADIALTLMKMPLRWVRMTSRLFAAGTIVANATAGWPDPIGMGLRIAAPTLFVILTEIGRAVILHRQRRDDGTEDDYVPLSRWFLAPVKTFKMWRRQKLWGVKSYKVALDMEIARQLAVRKLSKRYGKGWQKAIPGDLAWMLRNGVRMDEALTKVAELTAPPAKAEQPNRNKGGTGGRNANRNSTRNGGGTAGRNRNRKPAGTGTAERGASDQLSVDDEARILALTEQGWTEAQARALVYIEKGNSPSRAGVLAGGTDRLGRKAWGMWQSGNHASAGKDLE